jgi:hypothetical protein
MTNVRLRNFYGTLAALFRLRVYAFFGRQWEISWCRYKELFFSLLVVSSAD